MATVATITLVGDKIKVNKLLEKINEFMVDAVNDHNPIDSWDLHIKGG